MRRRQFLSGVAGVAAGALAARAGREGGAAMLAAQGEPLRIGILGCGENTHGRAWGPMLSSPDGARFGMKPTRVWDADPAVARELAEATGATAVEAPERAGEDVDGVLITEAMPDRFLDLAAPFLEAGVRVFLNRPFAGSVADAKAIVRLAEERGAPIYSASALYHTPEGDAAREALPGLAPLRLFNMTGASDSLIWYLPHSIEALVAVLGTGVETVQAVSLHRRPEAPDRAGAPVVVYIEYAEDSSVGPARGVIETIGPDSSWYAFVLKLYGAATETAEVRFTVTYEHLLLTMAEFFRTGVEPVPHAVILEKTAILYAALRSADKGGVRVSVREMLTE